MRFWRVGHTLFREQAHALMDGLEISRFQIGISPGHFQRGVAENPLKMEDASAAP